MKIPTFLYSSSSRQANLAIAVPELWIYDNGRLTIYLLRDGRYTESDTSPIFPNIPITQIIPTTVERAWQVGSFQALEEFEKTFDRQ